MAKRLKSRAQPKRQRKMKNALKNAELGSEAFANKVLAWHRQVAQDFEKEFGDEVHLWVANALFVRTGDLEGQGTLSWVGNPPNTIDMIGHLIRQIAKDGVKFGGMTPAVAGKTLLEEIVKVAALKGLEQYMEVQKDVEEVDVNEKKIIT